MTIPEPVPSKLSQRRAARADWDTYWTYHQAPGYVNHTPQLIETIERHIDLHGCRVLEVGVGTGGNSSTLASLGAMVTALDFSMPALQRAVATAFGKSTHIVFAQGDAHRLPFGSDAFDLVFHQGFLEHFANPADLIHEQRRVLRADGYILVDVPQRYNWYTVHKHLVMCVGRWPYGKWEREFSLSELCALLEAQGYRVVDAYGRGYYPRPFRMLRNLRKIETNLLKCQVFPDSVWRMYDAWWRRFEQSRLGCSVLQSIGVLAQVSG